MCLPYFRALYTPFLACYVIREPTNRSRGSEGTRSDLPGLHGAENHVALGRTFRYRTFWNIVKDLGRARLVSGIVHAGSGPPHHCSEPRRHPLLRRRRRPAWRDHPSRLRRPEASSLGCRHLAELRAAYEP